MAHWYTRNEFGHGVRYRQLTKKGVESKVVKTAQALKDGAVRGVMDLLDRGGAGPLIHWSGKLGVESGIDALCAKVDGVQKDVCLAAFDAGVELFTERREAAAESGKLFHDAIDQHIQGTLYAGENTAILRACQECVAFIGTFGVGEFKSEVCFVADFEEGGVRYRYGGTPDFACPAVCLDWKTVEDARDARIKELAQLATYRKALGYDKARCVNVYISRVTGAIVGKREWTEEELALGWEYFTLAYKQVLLEDRFMA